jgi:hypothetical protein
MVTLLGFVLVGVVFFWFFGYVRSQSAFFRASLLAVARELDERCNKLDGTLKSIEQSVDEMSQRLSHPSN